MRFLCSTTRARNVFDSVLAGSALVGFLVANVGLPLPQPIVAVRGKDKSKSFPCQNRRCGCMSAEQCYKSCCCFTATERLAWAKAHDVEPPGELVAAADGEHERGGCEHGHCAAPSVAPKCCSAKSRNARPAAGEVPRGSARDLPHDDTPADGWQMTFIVGMLAGQCHGMGPMGLWTSIALPPVSATSWSFDWCFTGWTVPEVQHFFSISLDLPTRPPCI